MKKLIMLFGAMALIFSTLFVLTAVALASDADLLQPASTVTYNEDLAVNGTGRFNSIQIGQEGVGGVTYFNGTVVNVGEYVPFTIGDDMRLDGELWRGASKGVSDGMPIKVSDSMIPTMDDINDLGWPEKRWQNIYFSNMLSGNNVNLNGELSLQSTGSSPASRISMSNNENTLLSMGNSKIKAQGLRYENYTGNYEVNFGKQVITNFMGSGTDVAFHGFQTWNKNNGSMLFSGLVKNHPEYDAVAWTADIDDTGDNTLGIAAGKTVIDGKTFEARTDDINFNGDTFEVNANNTINLKSQSIYMDSIKTLRFEGVEIRVYGGKCQVKLDGVWKDVEPGTLLRGNNGSNTELRYCESNTWEDLY